MNTTQQFTDANFQKEFLENKGLAIVDFFAVWCGPCRMVAPILDELAGKYAGKVKIGKMDVDENHDTPSKYGVMSIPTIIFLKGGQEVDRIVGFQSKEALEEKIKTHM